MRQKAAEETVFRFAIVVMILRKKSGMCPIYSRSYYEVRVTPSQVQIRCAASTLVNDHPVIASLPRCFLLTRVS